MEENQGGFYRQERMLGRRVIVILPIFVLVIITVLAYMALPLRYYFTVEDGDVQLMAAKVPWLSSQRSSAFTPIPVSDLNVETLVGREFESQADALLLLRKVITKRVQDRCREMANLEMELAKAYTPLLQDLKIARSIGADGLDEQIGLIQGWLKFQAKKAESMAKCPANPEAPKGVE